MFPNMAPWDRYRDPPQQHHHLPHQGIRPLALARLTSSSPAWPVTSPCVPRFPQA